MLPAASVPVFASEVTGQAPFSESLRAGEAVAIDYAPSFVDGIGGPHVEPEMWTLSQDLLAGSIDVTLEEVADAIRRLVTRLAKTASYCVPRVVLTGSKAPYVSVATLHSRKEQSSNCATLLS